MRSVSQAVTAPHPWLPESSSCATVLVVSPHLDDAVLSIGATLHALAQAGHAVLIVTVFSGDPPHGLSPVANAFHADCGLGDDAMAVRREEDLYAVRRLDCRAHHLDFADAIYRQAEAGHWLCGHDRAMFTEESGDRPGLRDEIADAVAALSAQLSPAVMLTCAAIGGHVDHRLTRQAVTATARQRGLPLVLWQDLPYAVSTEATAPPDAYERASYPGDDAWEAKAAAVACYRSQLRMLWPEDQLGWRRQYDHGLRVGTGRPAELGWVFQ